MESGSRNLHQRLAMVAALQDRIEVSGVDCGKRRGGQQGADDLQRAAGTHQGRFERAVVGAVAAARVYDLPAHQVDDRDDQHNVGTTGSSAGFVRIFVYEHITGGGCLDALLPEGLLAEALLMLRALIADLADCSATQVIGLRDHRVDAGALPAIGRACTAVSTGRPASTN